MPLTARNPRRARLVVTLAGLAVGILGGVLWLVGDSNEVTGANGMDMSSSAAWNGVVDGFESDQTSAYEEARDQKEAGESQMTWGVVLGVLGLALVASRWLIQSAAPSKPTTAAGTLTPEEQEQAVAMYLKAQKRTPEEK
ncbi:hypothetical protein ACF07M_30215 [Streptomyces globisporus]|uniref:hypothetical protein n=1 Tax=Streptomyces globisporus TaxID=1908 RepID=UPI0036FBA6A5